MSTRNPITIRFRFNQATGQIEQFLIDDGDRTAPEAYHNQMAQAIAGRLFRRPQVADAGLEAIAEVPANLTAEEIRQREQ